ncbi:MAG: hypothetical protein VW455_02290 [Nitrospinota bacterium]
MVSTTVNTKIVVRFEDQFTESAQKSLENYKKALEGINRVQNDKGFKVIADLLKDLENAEPIEFQILPPNVRDQLREIEVLLRSFQAQNPFLLHLELVDKATEEALEIRKKIEKTFSKPIIQKIKVKKIGSKGSNDSDFDIDKDESSANPGAFDGTSVNPGGFDTFGSLKAFSTGIDRVPRDMLAIIYKDEAVLNKTQAEERRLGNTTGMAIKNVNINLNLPDSVSPSNMSRQNFRQLAVQLQDELRRLERRRSK